ncbi:MAG TPA: hypothetical protein VIO64_01570 [Pseudobacteroides sp.]|uniref:hypothetical protein n=1 Tax=Pseudobacteroides sp. TaxID=1968840 RepID=UPI002F949232
MAGNAGHPFFGNQYVSSSYTGGYHYDWIPNSNVTEVFTHSAKTVSDNIKSISSSAVLPQSAKKILPRASKCVKSGKGAMIAVVVVSVVATIGTGAYFLYRHINKKHKSEEAFQAIELENVGTCKKCNEPLSGAEYVDENTSDSHTAYIICKKCGEKNYAWYPDDENSQKLSQ